MKMEISIKKKSILSMCLAAYYAIVLLYRIKQILFQDSVAFSLILQLGTVAVIIVALLQLIQKAKNIQILIILELIVGVLFIISNFMGNLGDIDFWATYRHIALIYIPLSIAAYNIVDKVELLKALYIISVISVPILILLTVTSYSNWASVYNMGLGYNMAFSALVILADFAVNNTIRAKIFDIVLAAVMCIFILFVGSRGAFICIFSFVIFEFLLTKRFSMRTKVLIVSLIVIMAVLVMIFLDAIMMSIYQVAQSLGFDSRNLNLLMQGEIFSHDSGRNELWEHYITLINQSPILGYGIMGKWYTTGNYPHNIFLELVLAFGYPVGIILLVILVVVIIRGIRCYDKYDEYSSVIAVIFISYCMHLLVSDSFMNDWQFFVCLAFCMAQPQKIRVKICITKKNSMNTTSYRASSEQRSHFNNLGIARQNEDAGRR